MGTYVLTSTAQQIDQAVLASFSGAFPDGSGIVFRSGEQVILGLKTFSGQIISRGGFDASGVVSGTLSPYNNGLVNLGEATKKFGTLHSSGVISETGLFNNLVVTGTFSAAALNISASPLDKITVTGTGYIQNIRATGSVFVGGNSIFIGDINSSGSNSYSGPQDFNGDASFAGVTYFESGFASSGTSSFSSASFSSVSINGPFYQTGSSITSGTLVHVGSFSNGGVLTQTGNVGVLGNLVVTGDVGVTGGSVSIRANTFLTTGSALDRLRIVQPVDITGGVNITGSIACSSNVTIGGNLSASTITSLGSGYLSGVRISGELNVSGSSFLSGQNNFSGTNTINGSTAISGNVTFNGSNSNKIFFNNYVRPYIGASGIGSNSVKTLALTNFWSTAGNAVAPGTGIWITPYSGFIGEQFYLLTGSNSSASNNNNCPLGTYGRIVLFTNVGVKNGSGIWSPTL